MHNKVLVITGTTASGKTAAAVELALRFNGEIISADSMQVYKLMDIGTAKPTVSERKGVPHYMMDIIMPDEIFTLADYLDGAKIAVKDILSRGKLPIIVGGTGLYISSFIKNIDLCETETDKGYREYLRNFTGEELMQMLKQVDPERADRIHHNDVKRLSRALELYRLTGLTAEEQEKKSKEKKSPFEFLSFCLTCQDRDALYDRINFRVDEMIISGLEKEVRSLYEKGYLDTGLTAAQAIGYKEFLPYFRKEKGLVEVIAAIKQESRRYAKRQLTWFRKEPFFEWVYINSLDKKNFENLLNFLVKRVEFFINI